MEQQIQDLVDSIRKEGIDEANRERDSIISKAQKEADRIIWMIAMILPKVCFFLRLLRFVCVSVFIFHLCYF